MLANVVTRTIDDRWRSTAIGTAIVGVFLLGGLAAYRQIDLSVYNDMPLALRSLMNIPADADIAALGFGAIYGMVGAMTLTGLALSMGASSIAGEERDGTIGLLLASPRTRSHILASKLASMVVVVALGALIMGAAGQIAPKIVGVDMGGAHVDAFMLHLYVNALLFGALAAAVGAWTGNRVLAVSVAAGVMVVSYLGVGLLPLSTATADLVRLLPWHYFDGSQPLVHGVDPAHLAVQLGSGVALAAVAFIGLNRRDLRSPGAIRSLVDQIREHPRAGQVLDLLGGGSHVGHIWTHAASAGRPLLLVTSAVMFTYMGVLLGPMFASIESTLVSVADAFPEEMLALFGGGDISTPEGWYQTETFGLSAPIAIMLVTISFGSKALAGEEADGTMGLLLANPVRRSRIVLEKIVAMSIHAVTVAFATFAGVTCGSLLAGLGMNIADILAICIHLTLLGILFGMLALAIGAATGDVRHAVFGSIGAAATAYLANSLLTITTNLDAWAALSPLHWYAGNEPLVHGMQWGDVALLFAGSVVLAVVAVVGFERRDLRNR